MIGRWLKGWRRARDPAKELEEELRRLDAAAAAPAPDFRAAVHGRAGDLCVAAGDVQRAIVYYGRSIDGYLAMAYYDAAAAMCRKVIEVAPSVVRARCTLAFLLLGERLPNLPRRGVPEDVLQELRGYVQAAISSGRQATAIQRLSMLAGVTDSKRVRTLIADLLFELGANEEGADLVLERLEEAPENAGGEGRNSPDQRERWVAMLQVAIMGE